VISRVTGGEASQIDGTLRSTIPGADVWLLNPSGVVFSAGAALDVKGSFHGGTGDYVGFEGSLERFYGDPSLPSVLATAPPAAFGFLPGGGAASLAVEGRLEVIRGEAELLSGGNVSLSGAELSAPGAHLSFEASGEVRLSGGSLVDVGGDAPGSISIRGGRIVINEGSQLLAENEGTGPGGHIEVEAGESLTVDAGLLSVSTSSAGDAGTIDLEGREVRFRNGPGVANGFGGDRFDPTKLPRATPVGAAAETLASGAAGAIEIDAESVEVTDGAGLSAATVGAVGADGTREEASGPGGRLDIQAESLRVANRGFLKVDSWGSRGDAGRPEALAHGRDQLWRER
jgi:large exoprotein involved in heme utilization and adhesion